MCFEQWTGDFMFHSAYRGMKGGVFTIWVELTYSCICSVCPVPMLKFSHLSTLTPSTNGVNWEKENSFQLSLTSASLSY